MIGPVCQACTIALPHFRKFPSPSSISATSAPLPPCGKPHVPKPLSSSGPSSVNPVRLPSFGSRVTQFWNLCLLRICTWLRRYSLRCSNLSRCQNQCLLSRKFLNVPALPHLRKFPQPSSISTPLLHYPNTPLRQAARPQAPPPEMKQEGGFYEANALNASPPTSPPAPQRCRVAQSVPWGHSSAARWLGRWRISNPCPQTRSNPSPG